MGRDPLAVRVVDPAMEIQPPVEDRVRDLQELLVKAQRDFERGMAMMVISDQWRRLAEAVERLSTTVCKAMKEEREGGA